MRLFDRSCPTSLSLNPEPRTLNPPTMFIRKLAISNFAVRKMRVALTVSAIALSVSLVVAVASGYASLEEAAFRFLSQYMGGTDATILRQNDPVGGVPESLVQELRNDP